MDSDSVSSFSFCEPATMCLADVSLLDVPHSDSVRSQTPQDDRKPAKKRKSWGQELPIPKTNLPPRKRAKTEDEKEQRRIERVLRNRQAAQSSRERKRQEVEKLESERDVISQQNHLLRQRLLQVEGEKFKMKQELAEMRALLKKHAGELTPSSTPSPIISSEIFNENSVKDEIDEFPSLFPSTPTASASDALELPSAPAQPLDAAVPSDLTQHPAAVLCDLQCQSNRTSPSSSAPRPPAATPSDPQRALATLLLFQTIHMSVSSTMLSPLSRLLASLKRGSPLKTRTITPMLFTLIMWLISTPTSRPTTFPPTFSTSAPPTSKTPSTSSTSAPSTIRLSTFRTSLLRRLLACSPALARPLKDATARALREKASYALRESSDRRCSSGVVAAERRRGVAAGLSAPKAEVWRLMTMALVIDQFLKERDYSQSA